MSDCDVSCYVSVSSLVSYKSVVLMLSLCNCILFVFSTVLFLLWFV